MVLLTIVSPLVIGAMIYYFYFPSVWLVRKIDALIGIEGRTCISSSNIVLKVLRYYLLDLIWAFSFFNAIYIIYENSSGSMVISLIVTIVLGTALEISQLCGFSLGTFDVFDIVAELSGALLGLIFIKCFRRIIKNEKS